MARKHKVVGPSSSVPERVSVGYQVDVIFENVLKACSGVIGVRSINIEYDINHTHWKEERDSLIGMFG